jgi:hypothetical protein
MTDDLLGTLELDNSSELYTGKLSHKTFYFADAETFVEKPYLATLELSVQLLGPFKQLLQTGLLDKAEQLVADEFLETANMSRAAEDDLTVQEFKRRLTLVGLEVRDSELYFTFYDGGACGGHYLTLTSNWESDVLDFNMMG